MLLIIKTGRPYHYDLSTAVIVSTCCIVFQIIWKYYRRWTRHNVDLMAVKKEEPCDDVTDAVGSGLFIPFH